MSIRSKRTRNTELVSYGLNHTYKTLSFLSMELPTSHECSYPKINCKNRFKDGSCRNQQCCYEIDNYWSKNLKDIDWNIKNIIEKKKVVRKKKTTKRTLKMVHKEQSIRMKEYWDKKNKGKLKCENCDKPTFRNILHSNGSQDSKIHFFCSMECKENWIYKIHEKVK